MQQLKNTAHNAKGDAKMRMPNLLKKIIAKRSNAVASERTEENLPHYEGEKIKLAFRPVHYCDREEFYWCPTMTKDEARGMVHEYRNAAGINPFADFVKAEYDLTNEEEYKKCMDRLAKLPNEMRNIELYDAITEIKPTGFVIWIHAEYDD